MAGGQSNLAAVGMTCEHDVRSQIGCCRQEGREVTQNESHRLAAWAGLLVTAFNLFPIGQLDGGHVAYALWGHKAWKLARISVSVIFGWGLVLIMMGNQAGSTWLVWGGLSSLMGPRHPPPLNDVTPLDGKRKLLGWAMIAVFVIIIIPVPLIQSVIG